MPGLVNAHTHSGMTILRNFANDLALEDWLFGNVLPWKRNLHRKTYTGYIAGNSRDDKIRHYDFCRHVSSYGRSGKGCFGNGHKGKSLQKSLKDSDKSVEDAVRCLNILRSGTTALTVE